MKKTDDKAVYKAVTDIHQLLQNRRTVSSYGGQLLVETRSIHDQPAPAQPARGLFWA
jgi:hypothetical protein